MTIHNRTMLTVVFLACGLVWNAFAGGSGEAVSVQGEEVSAGYSFAPGGTVEVSLETGGEIVVAGWERDEVQVTIRKESDDPEIISVSVRDTPRRISVSSEYTVRRVRGNHAVHVEIQAPRDVNLEIDSIGGGVSVSGIHGTLNGRTMGGDVSIETFAGEASFETMGGTISVTSVEIDGTLKTMGGTIELADATGDFSVETMGGDILWMNQESPRTGPTRLKTMGGSITIGRASPELLARTMGGDISIEDAPGNVDLESMGGAITVGRAGGSVQAVTMGGDLSVTMARELSGTGYSIHLESKGGNVALSLPRGFPVDIEAVLEITDDSRDDFGIFSDITVDERVEEGSRLNGLRETRTAAGQSGGGGNTVYLSTVNGDITITEQ